MLAVPNHQHVLRGITHRLDGEFGHLLTHDTIEHYVEETYAELASNARVLNFIPAFVERFTRERLRALSKNTGEISGFRPVVLFVCERSDGCSLIAEAVFNAQVGEQASARSAGSRLGSEMAADVVSVLGEVGIGAPAAHPRPIGLEAEAAADVVITLDEHDDIPVLDGKHYEAWRTTPPAVGDREAFRQLRDEITERVGDLVARILPGVPVEPEVLAS